MQTVRGAKETLLTITDARAVHTAWDLVTPRWAIKVTTLRPRVRGQKNADQIQAARTDARKIVHEHHACVPQYWWLRVLHEHGNDGQ